MIIYNGNHHIPKETPSGRLPDYKTVWRLPPGCKTRRMLLKLLRRPTGKPVGTLTLLHEQPHAKARNVDAWDTDNIRILRQRHEAGELDSTEYGWLQRTGQLTVSNVFDKSEAIEQLTEAVAQEFLEIALFDDSHREHYIVKHQKDGNTVKATWQKRFSKPDLSKHLEGRIICGPKRGDKVQFIAPDLDRHSGEVPAALHQERCAVVAEVIRQFSHAVWRPEVNPDNGSVKFFGWLPMAVELREAQSLVKQVRRALIKTAPQHAEYWEKFEIYPGNSPQVYAPLHPHKITVTDAGVCPKVRRYRCPPNIHGKKKRKYFTAYSVAEYVTGVFLDKKQFSNDTFLEFLAEACARCPDLPPEKIRQQEQHKREKKQREKVGKNWLSHKAASPATPVSLKGRFIPVLLAFLTEADSPPDGSLNKYIGYILRLAWAQGHGQKDAVHFIMSHLRQRRYRAFSGRLSNEDFTAVETMTKATAKQIWTDNGYQDDPATSAKKLGAVAAYCARIGFDILKPETWGRYRGQSGEPAVKLVWTDTLRQKSLELVQHLKGTPEQAERFLSRVLCFLQVQGELALSLVGQFIKDEGLHGDSQGKQWAVRKFLEEAGLIKMVKRYYHDPVTGYRHGDRFICTALVRFEGEVTATPAGDTHTTTQPLSIYLSVFDPMDEQDMAETLLEARRLQEEEAFQDRRRRRMASIRRAA